MTPKEWNKLAKKYGLKKLIDWEKEQDKLDKAQQKADKTP